MVKFEFQREKGVIIQRANLMVVLIEMSKILEREVIEMFIKVGELVKYGKD
jgi:hypothetical protein